MIPGVESSLVSARLRGRPALTGKPKRVALLGFGTVGQSVARILLDRSDVRERLQLTHVFNRNVAGKRVAWTPRTVVWTERIDEVFASRPDVVIEAVGGLHPAAEWVRRALQQGASVITANKLLIAAHGHELLKLAAAHGAELRFEASVAGGVPLIHAVRHGLAGDVITRVAGIVNGTCNYILSRMAAEGASIDAALADAQRLGYAEADPSADLDGVDAAAKLVVLAGVAFKRQVRPADVPARSIRAVEAVDFRYARRLGATIRQISEVEAVGEEGLYASVGPALVPEGSSFGRNGGASNTVAVTGRYGGTTAYSGAGAGGDATAVAVVSDLLGLSDRAGHHGSDWSPARLVPPPARSYYVRFVVTDRPGILAGITAALARRAINVDAVLQEPGFPKDRLPFVVTVEPCIEADLRAALDDIGRSPEFETPLVLPMVSA